MPIYKINNLKDGKQGYRVRVSYIDANGNRKRKSKIVYGSPEARQTEQEMLMSLNEYANNSSITVNELFEMYIESKRSEIRETTLAKTERILKSNVLSILGDVKLDKLDTRKLQSWKNTINEKDLCVRTKKNIYSEFRTMLNYAVRMDYLLKNPLLKVGNFKEVYFEKPQDKLHYYTAEEFKRFISAAENHIDTDRGFYVFFNIAFYTGMRKGEINALKWSDIEDNIIHVRRSVAQKVKGKAIVETPPKNKTSYRDLQMPQKLKSILNEHMEYQKGNLLYSNDFRVCGGAACLSDTGIANRNIQYADEAGLPRIRIHDFRHSHASLLANEGINIQEIARRLGHSKIEITWNTYSHLYPREEERAVKVLDSI